MDNTVFAPDDIKEMVSPDMDYLSMIQKIRENGDFYVAYEKREKFRVGTSWHVPNQELVSKLLEHGPIVSVGSGFAYTESIAIVQGADIIATDIQPNKKNGWCREGKFHCKVEKLNAEEAVKKYEDRNVFMAWPPYDNPMAHTVVTSMKVGTYLIYVGEGHGGCTGDDNFFGCLYNDFEEVDCFNIPKWSGINDACWIYKKIK
jgi:hypothetical protein